MWEESKYASEMLHFGDVYTHTHTNALSDTHTSALTHAHTHTHRHLQPILRFSV